MKFKIYRNMNRPAYKETVPYIDGKVVEGGEGYTNIEQGQCKIHGITDYICGFNQGGYDSVAICLKCCAEIHNNLHLLKEPMEEITTYPEDEVTNG